MHLSEEEFIKLWKGDESAIDIAARLQMPLGQILTRWRRLKAIGRLPDGERPRNSITNAKYRINQHAESIDYKLTVGNDRLLEKLRKEHG
jgi:hypothetical protein